MHKSHTIISRTINLTHAHSNEDAFQEVFIHVVAIVVFIQTSLYIGKRIVEFAIKSKRNTEGELFTLCIVAYALTMATISEELELSLEAGALFAGICLLGSPHVPKVLGAIRPITSVFGGMYVTSLGMIISPAFVNNNKFHIFMLVGVIGIVKVSERFERAFWKTRAMKCAKFCTTKLTHPILCASLRSAQLFVVSNVMTQCFGFDQRNSLVLSCSFAQISEGSLVILAKAQRLGFVGRQTYLHLIPVTCILLSLVPFSAGLMRNLGGSRGRGGDFALRLLTPITNRMGGGGGDLEMMEGGKRGLLRRGGKQT